MDTTSRTFELDATPVVVRGRLRTILIVALSFLTIPLPFLVAQIPPLTDYPNHLARFWLLAGGATDPAMARYFGIDWSYASTNVGVDRVVAALAPWIPGLVGGQVALILAALLPPLGLLALSFRLSGRLTAWHVLFPVAAWSTTFLMGFLNFQIGLGLALLFAAIDPLARPGSSPVGALMRIPLGLVLAIDHVFSLLFYAALLAALAIGPASLALWSWRDVGRRALKGAVAAGWCLVPLALITLLAPALPGERGLDLRFDALPAKLATLMSPMVSYNLGLELLMVLGLAGLIAWLAVRRTLEVHQGLLLAASGFACLAILAPAWAADTAWVDRRFPIMGFLCLLASIDLKLIAPRRIAAVVGIAALALVSARGAWIGWNWNAAQGDLRATIRAIRDVPAGAAVLPLQHRAAFGTKWNAPAGRYIWQVGDPTFRHYPALAVPLQRAFVPTLFAVRGKQPLKVLGSWDRYVDHNGGDLASVSVLTRSRQIADPTYMADWPHRFSYVLVLNADLPDEAGPFRPPANLKLVSDQGFAQLWRITP